MSTNPTAIETCAMLYAQTGDTDMLKGLTSWAIEEELVACCKRAARPDETEASAITRVCTENETAKALARAAYAAEQIEAATLTSGQRLAKFREHLGVADMRKAAPAEGTKAEIATLLDRIAKSERRDGETFYDAYGRLMQEDPQFQASYAKYLELAK